MDVVDVDICILSHLKEELTWAIDKRLRIISTIMLFKNSNSTKELKNKAVLNLKQYYILVGLCVGGSKRKSVLYMP